jgi:hypothetical protein
VSVEADGFVSRWSIQTNRHPAGIEFLQHPDGLEEVEGVACLEEELGQRADGRRFPGRRLDRGERGKFLDGFGPDGAREYRFLTHTCTRYGRQVLRTLNILPLGCRYICLSEDGSQEIFTDIASMGIRNPHPEMLFEHKLVFPSRIRTTKTPLAKAANQFGTRC